MATNDETQAEQYDQDAVWNEVIGLIQNEAKSLQTLMFGQYKLAYQVLKQQIASTLEPSAPLNQASLESNLNGLIKKQSIIQTQFQADLDTIEQLRADNQDHPRSLLILDVAEKNVKKLRGYALNHEPTLQTLENDIHAIQTSLPEVLITHAEQTKPAG